MSTETKKRKALEVVKPTPFVPKPVERFVAVRPSDGALLKTDYATHIPTTHVLDMITSDLGVYPNIVLTPAMNMDLLTRNNANRPIDRALISRYARDMAAGEFPFAGNQYMFDKNGNMLDGQHTALASIKSGKNVIVNIQTGLEPEVFAVINTGKPRSGSDVVAIAGFPHQSHAMASAIKSILFFNSFGRLRTNIRYSAVTNHAIRDWTKQADEMKLMGEGVAFIEDFKAGVKGGFLHLSTWLFIWYCLSKIHMGQAKEFMGKLATGENLSGVILLLRDKLKDFGAGHLKELKKGGIRVTELKIRYVFRAWNAWRTKEELTKLSINTGEVRIEKPI